MITRIKALGFLIYVSSILLLFSSSALSQQNTSSPDSDLSKRSVKFSLKAQRFDDVIAMLSTQFALNILVDDQPLPQQVTLEFEGNAKEALDRVSDAFDYTWKQRPGGIVVMYKRFHNASEHPQYHLPELRRMAHNVADIFKAINIDPTDDFTARTNVLFGMLSPPQVEMLRTGKIMRGSDLTAEQGEALQAAILRNMFFGQVVPWQDLPVELDGVDHSFFQLIESPPFLRFYFTVKPADGPIFSRFLAGMQSDPTSKETAKP